MYTNRNADLLTDGSEQIFKLERPVLESHI